MKLCHIYLLIFCLWSSNALASGKRVPQFLDGAKPITQPHRIVSLAPVITETLFTLGLGESIVGVTRFCDRPAAAQKITKIGGFIDGNLEKIVSIKPTIVIAMPQNAQKDLLKGLDKQNIPVYLVFGDRIKEVKEMVLALGQLFDKANHAKNLISNFEKKYDDLKSTITVPNQSIVALASTQPLIVAGSDTFIQESLTHMGFKTLPQTTSVLWPTWSIEVLVKTKPTWILLLYPNADTSSLKNKIERLCAPDCRFITPKKALFQRPGLYMQEDMLRLKGLIARKKDAHEQ